MSLRIFNLWYVTLRKGSIGLQTFNSHIVKPNLDDGSSHLPTKVILGAFQSERNFLNIRFNIITEFRFPQQLLTRISPSFGPDVLHVQSISTANVYKSNAKNLPEINYRIFN